MVEGMMEKEPILAGWKISEVLKRYPELLDVLVDIAPPFQKLRNPLMRKVQTRLVTVRQAAGIAGIDPGQLVRTLNQAVGITPPDESTRQEDAGAELVEGDRVKPSWLDIAPIVRELDVREMLEKGQEPFRLITGSAREVGQGEVLRLVTNFEPLPLFDALGKQGFSHWADQLDDNVWATFFHRDTAEKRSAPAVTASVDWDAAAAAEVTIDVSELVPPEPMVRILQALEELPDGARLLVHHVRRPMHLYDRLDEMGYAHDTREIGPERVEVMIQKPAPAR